MRGSLLQYASPDLHKDREVWLAAFKTDNSVVDLAPPAVRKRMANWRTLRLLFLGQRCQSCRLAWLPLDVVRGPLLDAVLQAL